ncbi:MAG: T9SS type A sorting domain-containing protein [Bacteroidales bacterium]
MKTFILITVTFFSVTALGQSTLTNEEVYDFETGDIFQTEYRQSNAWGPVGVPVYKTRTIIDKSTSSSTDTIFYTIQRDIYSPPSCQGCTAVFSTDTLTDTITNLNQAVTHNNQTICLPIIDSIYTDYCSRMVWAKMPGQDTGCFEPVTHTTKFVKGAGGPYYNKTEPAGYLFTVYDLIYYYKAPDTCGSLVTSVKNPVRDNPDISISPNPVTDQATIRLPSDHSGAEITIYSLQGKVIRKYRNINSRTVNFERGKLPSGLYIVSIFIENKYYTDRMIMD